MERLVILDGIADHVVWKIDGTFDMACCKLVRCTRIDNEGTVLNEDGNAGVFVRATPKE